MRRVILAGRTLTPAYCTAWSLDHLESGPPGIWPLGVQSPEVPQMFDHLSTQGWLALTWVTLTSATAGFMNTIACGTGRDGTPLALWPTASTRSP